MKGLKAPIIVGIFTIAGILAFVVFYGGIEESVVHRGEGYKVYAFFDDVTGLAKFSRVTMSGIPVGTIEEISLQKINDIYKARITIYIRGDIELFQGLWDEKLKIYKNGATITRRMATMLGDYFLEITPGFKGKKLKDGDTIPNIVEEAGLSAILRRMENLSEIFPKLNTITNDISVITSSLSDVVGGAEGQKKLKAISENVSRAAKDISEITSDIKKFVTKGITTKIGEIDKIVENFLIISKNSAKITSETGESLIKSLHNLEEITDEIKNFIKGTGDEEKRIEGLKELTKKMHTAVDDLNSAIGHFKSITEKVDEGKGTLGKLINDEKLINKMEEMVKETGSLLKSITRLETIIGFRSEFNFHQRAMKNYFTLKLQPRPDKYYLIELVFDPRGRTITTQKLTLSNNPSLPPALTEEITETTSDLKFTLEFAKKFYFITGRFGLKETTGGIGLDFDILKDSMMLSFDIFDFSSNKYPRLKWFWMYEFVKHFYITAGMDDILNRDTWDYFAGIGFKFSDEDLKALLITAPIPSP